MPIIFSRWSKKSTFKKLPRGLYKPTSQNSWQLVHEINNEKMNSTVSLSLLSSWRQWRQEKARRNLSTSQMGWMHCVYLIRKRQTSWSESVKLKKLCVCASVPMCWVERSMEMKLSFLTTSATLLFLIHCLFYDLRKFKLHLIRGKYSKDGISNINGIMMIWTLMVFPHLLFF